MPLMDIMKGTTTGLGASRWAPRCLALNAALVLALVAATLWHNASQPDPRLPKPTDPPPVLPAPEPALALPTAQEAPHWRLDAMIGRADADRFPAALSQQARQLGWLTRPAQDGEPSMVVTLPASQLPLIATLPDDPVGWVISQQAPPYIDPPAQDPYVNVALQVDTVRDGPARAYWTVRLLQFLSLVSFIPIAIVFFSKYLPTADYFHGRGGHPPWLAEYHRKGAWH